MKRALTLLGCLVLLVAVACTDKKPKTAKAKTEKPQPAPAARALPGPFGANQALRTRIGVQNQQAKDRAKALDHVIQHR